MTTDLTPYNHELAKQGAVVCWEGGGATLRYVGPSTEPSCVGCFVWLTGPHKGTYASYQSAMLRMAPEPFREDGWYMVRKLGFGDVFGPWVPAEWRQEFKSWASTRFSGVPDSEFIVGNPISCEG